MMRRPWMLSLFALAAACVRAPAPPPNAVASNASVAVGRVVANASDFSGVVVVADAREVRFSRAVGWADQARKIPHRVDDVWPWASLTKQVTSLLVMQQIERGDVTLDTKIANALPTFRGATAPRLSVRDLLRHASGLPNPDATAEISGVPAFYAPSEKPLGLAYCEGAPKGEPGGDFEYNNCDYLVLGALLEHTTRKPYDALVADRIASPLGMTSIGKASAIVGYVNGRPAAPQSLERYGSSGKLTGTAQDVVAFDRALMGFALLGRDATEAMWSGDPARGYVALGAWSFQATLRGCATPVRLVERRGSIGGVQSRNILVPDTKTAIVVFTNNGDFDFGEIWQGKGFAYDLVSSAVCE